MIQNNEKGFTLVELLVTIGIIGILATITVASLSSTRGRARDGQRISDVKQMSSVLDAEFTAAPGSDEKGVALGGCVAKAITTGCTGSGNITETFVKFTDPAKPPVADLCNDAFVAASPTKPCNYTITGNTDTAVVAKTGDYRICVKVENDGSGFTKGVNKVVNGGTVSAGCW